MLPMNSTRMITSGNPRSEWPVSFWIRVSIDKKMEIISTMTPSTVTI